MGETAQLETRDMQILLSNFKVSVGAKCNGLKAQTETGAASVYEAHLSDLQIFTF